MFVERVKYPAAVKIQNLNLYFKKRNSKVRFLLSRWNHILNEKQQQQMSKHVDSFSVYAITDCSSMENV